MGQGEALPYEYRIHFKVQYAQFTLNPSIIKSDQHLISPDSLIPESNI